MFNQRKFVTVFDQTGNIYHFLNKSTYTKTTIRKRKQKSTSISSIGRTTKLQLTNFLRTSNAANLLICHTEIDQKNKTYIQRERVIGTGKLSLQELRKQNNFHEKLKDFEYLNSLLYNLLLSILNCNFCFHRRI